MAQSLAKILVHTVFSTKERRPFLRDRSVRNEMHHYLGGILNKLECQPLIVGGVEDHIHALCVLGRTCQPAEVVKEMKRGSTLWIKQAHPDQQDFAWQTGYGMFSIGFSQLDQVRGYISDQERHHQKLSFKEEYRLFLQRYAVEYVEYDERYVWD